MFYEWLLYGNYDRKVFESIFFDLEQQPPVGLLFFILAP